MAPRRLGLVASPYTGASGWGPLAAALPGATAVDYGGVSGPDWYEGAAARIAAAMDAGPWIAVLHSGAGGFAPAIAAAARRLQGFVFLDAGLPYPGASIHSIAPPELLARLRAVTADGRLAPWNAWFDADPTLRMIPDPGLRASFVAELPRIPFAYLEAVAPAHPAWEALPSAYVQLSRTYDRAAEQAGERGWQVRRALLHHLAMVSHPEVVAELLADLL